MAMAEENMKDPRDYLDELNFISKSPAKDSNGIANIADGKNVRATTTTLNGKNLAGNGKSKGYSSQSESTTKTNSNGTQWLSNGHTNSKGEGNANASTTTTRSIPSTTTPKLKTLCALVVCALIAIGMTLTYLHIGLRAFCPYDDQFQSYIVMQQVDQCPVPIPVEPDNKRWGHLQFWKKQKQQKDDIIQHIPAPIPNMYEILCRGTFNILHIFGALVHPRIHYKTTMPSVRIHSPCPEIPKQEKGKGNVNGNGNLSKILYGIYGYMGSKKEERTEKATRSNTEPSDNKDDWTFLVSVPLKLGLTPKEIQMGKELRETLKARLFKEDETLLNRNDLVEKKLNTVPWGGKTPWWFPQEENWGGEKEYSGSRLITAYLRIMKWPESRITNFPGSGVCADGCPTDFAIANTLEFRQKYMPWKMTPSAVTNNKNGWVYVRGYSPTRYHDDASIAGASILWLRPGLQKIIDHEAHTRGIMSALDSCIADAFVRSGNQMGKCNIVLDCHDVGLSKIPPIAPTKRILMMLQDNYPEKLGVFVIVNVSGAAQIFLNLVLPLLPAVVRQKIHVIPNDDEKRLQMMRELVDEKYIPHYLGGKDRYQFNANEYYKNSRYATEIISDEEGVEYYETMPYYAPKY